MNSRLILFIFGSLLCSACTWDDLFRQEEFRTITIHNATQAVNLFGPSLDFKGKTRNEFTVLARDFHILQIDNDQHALYQILPEDGKNISLGTRNKQNFLYEINKKDAICYLNNNPAAWEWLANAPERKIMALRSIVFAQLDEKLKPTQLDFLKRLTKNNRLGLIFVTYYSQNLIDILNILNPGWLYLARDVNSPAEETRLSSQLGLTFLRQRQLNRLILACSRADAGNYFQLISYLPGLKSLCLNSYVLEEAKKGSLPPNLTNLEELVITDDISDSTYLRSFKHLNRLVIRGNVKGKLAELKNLNDLKSLYFYGEADGILSLLPLQKLGYFSFPTNVSQEEFTDFCQEKSQLNHIELINCRKVNNFTPLRNLSQLKGLVLVNNSLSDINSLIKLEKLKYLVLSPETDPAKVKKIKSVLPHCQILYGEPFSYGFGWLIIPAIGIAVALGIFFLRRTGWFKK